MAAKCAVWCGLLLLVGSDVASSTRAAPPWQKMIPFLKRVEADPSKNYSLTEDHGPWLIVATTFVGESAPSNAQELVLELRKRFKLNAYSHRKRFDFTSGATTRGNQRIRYRTNELEEVAVLVGDFNSIDDPQAQSTLKTLKACRPNCMELDPNDKDARPMGEWRNQLWSAKAKPVDPKTKARGVSVKKTVKGPLGNAMLTTNPLLPDEYYVPKGIDRFVLDMNKSVKYSLLECPAKFTVKVATFSGASVIDQKKIKEIQKEGKEAPSRLAEAAEKAHKLTETLRSQGYEAYEFHDRGQSIVTVGSFNSPGSPRADGKTEIDPKIHTIMTTFGAGKAALPGVPNGMGAGTPKIFGGIPTDIYPMVVEVPRKTISGDYADRGFFSRK